MKKYLVLVLLFASSLAYSQKNDTCDYFSFGVYGGSYIGNNPIYNANNFISDISVDIEYRKSKELSFFINVLYAFTGNDMKKMFNELNSPIYTSDKNPETYRALITIGGRYYLRAEKINPYIQFGLAQEYSHAGEYSYSMRNENGELRYAWSNTGFNYSRLEIMAGAGLNIKLCKRLSLDFQYGIYQCIKGEDSEFMNHSINGGLKYNLF
jgi:opacity protein-like surface antigen